MIVIPSFLSNLILNCDLFVLQVINYLQRAEGREEERGEVRGVAPTCKTTAFNSLAECGPLTLFIFTVYDLCDPL